MARRFFISKLTGYRMQEGVGGDRRLTTTFYVYDTHNACLNVAEATTLDQAQSIQRTFERQPCQ